MRKRKLTECCGVEMAVFLLSGNLLCMNCGYKEDINTDDFLNKWKKENVKSERP